MSFASRGAETYRQQQVQTSSPVELVVTLYDGALRSLEAARDAIQRRDIRSRQDATNKALAIIAELQCTLDMTRGGEIAASLDRLYSYANLRLLEATMNDDAAPVEEVQKLFGILRDGWNQAAKG
jgi:flagellar protein FliS